MLPLFWKTRIVDDKQTFARRQQRHEAAPHGVPVPGRVRDEVLKRLIVARVGDSRQHRLHRFARAVAQQTLEIPTQRHLLQPVAEAALVLLEISQQPANARPRALIEHRRSAYRTSPSRTMSSIQITHGSLSDSRKCQSSTRVVSLNF